MGSRRELERIRVDEIGGGLVGIGSCTILLYDASI
jgi:hypothetical protein